MYKKVVVNLFTNRALLFLLYSDARRGGDLGSGGDGGGGSSGAGGERGMDAQQQRATNIITVDCPRCR